MNAATRILLLSNGHGEDLSGALIGRELQALGHRVEALPLVGHGRAYFLRAFFEQFNGEDVATQLAVIAHAVVRVFALEVAPIAALAEQQQPVVAQTVFLVRAFIAA